MRIINIIISVLVASMAFQSAIVYAETDQQVSNSLFLQGKETYEADKIEEALDLFSRALLLDPHNKNAQKALISISDSDKVPAKQKINLLQFEDLINYINDINEKTDYYEDKRNNLGKMLFDKGISKEALNKEMLAVKNSYKEKSEVSEYNNALKGNNPKDPLATVNKLLGFEKEQLLNKVMYLQKQCERLQEMSSGIDKTSKKQLVIGENITDNAKKTISEQKNNLQNLKNEINDVDNHIDDFGKNINEKDKQVKDLSGQIVDFALKLSEKEMLLSEKEKKLAELNKDLEELSARLELGQKIIKDKDQKISSLENKLNGANPDASKNIKIDNKTVDITKGTDKKITELDNMLKIYKQKIGASEETIEEKNGKIEDLNNKLVKLQEQLEDGRRVLFIKDKEAQAKDKQIRSLKNTIDRLRNRNDEKDDSAKELLRSKEMELKRLQKELRSYQQEFKKVNMEMANKDGAISTLEKQLSGFKKNLEDRDKKLQEKNDKLAGLEKQLADIKEKLQESASNLGNTSKKKEPVIDVEILGIKNKLKKINDYLDQGMGQDSKK